MMDESPAPFPGRITMPLTDTQRARIEERLKDERAQAMAALERSVRDHSRASEQAQSGDLSTMPLHPADLGTDTIDEEVDASNATRISRELAEIDEALERLYHTPEKFGICDDTGKEIPFERLLIIPWARTCNAAEVSARSR
jgi:RNA polymerase-binding transcription factor DksA